MTLTHSGGDITVAGPGASAVIAQSQTDAVKTDSGDVNVNLSDATVTGSQAGASGALVQASSTSVAGEAGDVTVNTSAEVYCLAEDCVAFELASNGATAEENGDLTLTNEGTIEGGEGGHAVALSGGKNNRVINESPVSGSQATMRTKGGIGDTVIKGTDGNDAVINRNGALLIGSIDLGGGLNSLLNDQGATYHSGAKIDLGGGTFTNNGTFSLGGLDNSMSRNNDNGATVLNGNFIQGASGELVINLDFQTGAQETDYADLFEVTGDATLDGFVIVEPLTGAAKPGTVDIEILKVEGNISGPGLQLGPNFASGTPSTTAVFKPSTYFTPSNGTQYLRYSVDYQPDGLTPNASNVGDVVNQIQDKGVPAYQPIADELLRLPTLGELQDAYDSLSGEGIGAAQQTLLAASALRGGNLLAGMNQYAFCRKDSSDCDQQTRYWLRGSRLSIDQDGNGNSGATSSLMQTVQTGVEHRIGSNALMGFAVDMDNTSYHVSSRWTQGKTEGVALSAYGMVWGESGFYAKGLVSVGAQSNSTQRLALGRPVKGDYSSYTLDANIELGKRFETKSFAVMPYAGLASGMLWQPSWSEDDATYGNRFHKKHTQSQRASLGISFDAEFALSSNLKGVFIANAKYERELSQSRGHVVSSLAAPDFNWSTESLPAPKATMQLDLGVVVQYGKNASMTFQASRKGHGGGAMDSAAFSLTSRF